MKQYGVVTGLLGFLRDYALVLAALLGAPLYAVTLAPLVYLRALPFGESWALAVASAPIWIPLV
ncbi:MAG: hypothetical protein KA148_13400, partial [Ottowia sp.]|nr:hypothetical protein [Ottowia sp.]